MSKRRIVDVDWRNFINKKSFKYSLAGFGSAMVAGVLFFVAKPIFHEINSSFAVKEFKTIGIVGTYRKHYHHFFDQLNKLSVADSREQDLVRELASVQQSFELEKAKNTENEVRKETKKIAETLKVEAGSPVARVPDGIEYNVPNQILPHQLQVLGMEYFRSQEYEKSAVIFTQLTKFDEDTSFQKPDNYLIAAISWYKLKHFENATEYLKLTQKHSKPGSVLFRQSLLWQSIVEKSRGNKGESQKALARLISNYPQSEEVDLINHSRMPASHEESKEGSDEK